MEYNLINPTRDALDFLREWEDPTRDYITAHTSGSTGTPKEIHLPKADMIASARATCAFFDLTPDSIMVCPLSASYIAGKMMIVRAIVSGAALFFERPSSNPLTGATYPPVDLLPVVPTQLPAIASTRQTIRNLIVGGAPMTPEQEISLAGSSINVYATYGMTETCSHVALRRIGSELYKGMPGISFSSDERQCLVINAPGYSFGQLITNDIVELQDEFTFRWLGRADNVIITGGLKVHPESVEQKINSLIDTRFYITSEPDDKWGNRVVLVIEEGSEVDDRRLLESMTDILPPHECPRKIYRVKEIPRTATGKIRRNPVA